LAALNRSIEGMTVAAALPACLTTLGDICEELRDKCPAAVADINKITGYLRRENLRRAGTDTAAVETFQSFLDDVINGLIGQRALYADMEADSEARRRRQAKTVKPPAPAHTSGMAPPPPRPGAVPDSRPRDLPRLTAALHDRLLKDGYKGKEGCWAGIKVGEPCTGHSAMRNCSHEKIVRAARMCGIDN
jgi:hypothetical protein